MLCVLTDFRQKTENWWKLGGDLVYNRQNLRTEKRIIDSFLMLLQEKTLERITIRELCAAADINRSTFYSHYDDIYALMRAISDHYYFVLFQDAVKPADLSVALQPKDAYPIIRNVLEKTKENQNIYRILFSGQETSRFKEKLRLELVRWCKNLYYKQHSGGVSGSESPALEIQLTMVMEGAMGILEYWLGTGCNISVDDMSDEILKFLTRNFTYLWR